ncbi:hypothetical protein [Kitasatospora sp. NPDC056181]|uniref:hypothetical protein n=1 Tax=Kitasatospora sp. NPDC056181 TaxID=3345737 RepID=UPI0035DEF2E7
MSTDDTRTPEASDASRDDNSTARERSAEERGVTAPTPKDVRAKADDVGGEDEEPEPPAADTKAP